MKALFEINREKIDNIFIDEFENHMVLPHFHSNIEVTYVAEGEISANIGGVTSTLKKGDAYAAINYDIHSYDTEAYSRIVVLSVPCDFVKSFMTFMSGKAFDTPFLISKDCGTEILYYLRTLRIEIKKPYNILKLNGYIYLILSLLADNLGIRCIKDADISFIQKDIMIYLHENYLRPISLTEISKHFEYEKCYFSNFFNKAFGCSLTEYINNLRAKHAAELLRKSNMSITEIALASGFENLRSLNRYFTKIFKATPTEYRTDWKLHKIYD